TAQDEAHPANRVKQLQWELIVDLAANARDMNIDNIVERRVPNRGLPHVTRDHFARYHRTTMDEEVLEQFEFPQSEVDGESPPSHRVPTRIHAEVGNLQHRRRIGIGAPMQRPQTGEQLWERERFYQIIVRARIKSPHAILN